ncbi:MAG: TldD/PmbA family protein [Candidatus Coatesbacteria bacterium]|nr:MAG: TldD/PmbA family protein [Candidatus Coatesbacteria bacterium]
MINKLKTLVSRAACDFAEARYEEGVTTYIEFDNTGLKTANVHTYRGGNVRVLVDGNFGVASFEDIDRAGDYLEKALDVARLRKGELDGFGAGEVNKDVIVVELDEVPADVPLEEKVEILRSYNDLMLSVPGIENTRISYFDRKDRKAIVNSDGTELDMTVPRVGTAFVPIAVEGDLIQQAGLNVGGIKPFGIYRNREEDIEAIAKKTAALLTAEPVKGGVYTAIINPELTGVFVHEAFGHTDEGDYVYKDEHMRGIMKLGRRFASEIVNFVDDGTLFGEGGYIPYDDEGTRSKKNYLIKEGILAGRMHSRETATLMGEPLTGNGRALNYKFAPIPRMTNTFVEAGETSFEKMLEAAGDGIYVRGARGGTGGETFTFTAEDGYYIRGGKLAEHVRDLKLQGNLFETLENIEAVGDDLFIPDEGVGGCGKWGQSPLPCSAGGPHILIKNVQIGGR